MRQAPRNGSNYTVVRGRSSHDIAVTTNAGNLEISDATNTTLAGLAAVFRFYRYRKLSFCILPNVADDKLMGGQFISTDLTGGAAPDLFNEFEGEACTFLGQGQSVTEWVHVPRHLLAGINEWYLTDADATDPLLDVQGRLQVGSSTATDTVTVVIEFEVEFKEMLDSNVILLNIEKINKTRKRKGLPEISHAGILQKITAPQNKGRARKSRKNKW